MSTEKSDAVSLSAVLSIEITLNSEGESSSSDLLAVATLAEAIFALSKSTVSL